MQIEIKYGRKFEFNRIKQTLSKLEWYKTNGYIPRLPENLGNNSDKDIEKAIDKDFNEQDYEKAGKFIEENLGYIEKFSSQLVDLPNEIEIILTKYGVGGSYNLPNKVIVNIAGNQTNKPILDVIKHELIHLIAEKEVLEKKLSHQDKEKLIRSIERNL